MRLGFWWWLVYLCVGNCYGVDAVARLVVTFVVVGGLLLFASRVGLLCDLYGCCVLWPLVLWVLGCLVACFRLLILFCIT